jgi:hypothetical protein
MSENPLYLAVVIIILVLIVGFSLWKYFKENKRIGHFLMFTPNQYHQELNESNENRLVQVTPLPQTLPLPQSLPLPLPLPVISDVFSNEINIIDENSNLLVPINLKDQRIVNQSNRNFYISSEESMSSYLSDGSSAFNDYINQFNAVKTMNSIEHSELNKIKSDYDYSSIDSIKIIPQRDDLGSRNEKEVQEKEEEVINEIDKSSDNESQDKK